MQSLEGHAWTAVGNLFFYVHELSSQWITYRDVSVGCAIWTLTFTEPYQFHPSLYHLAFLHAYKVVTVLWLKLKMLWPDRLGFSIWADMMEIVVFGHWRVWGSKCIYSFDPSKFVLRNCIRNKVVKMPQENDCWWIFSRSKLVTFKPKYMYHEDSDLIDKEHQAKTNIVRLVL